jgi:hypothetical protein
LALELHLGEQRKEAIASIPLDKEPEADEIHDITTTIISEAAFEDHRKLTGRKIDRNSDLIKMLSEYLRRVRTAGHKE